MIRHRPLAWVSTFAALALVACATPVVLSVLIDQGDLELAVGETRTLTATVAVAGGAGTSVTWSSSDPTVATIDGDGAIETLGVGSTQLTARSTVDPNESDTVQLEVTLPGERRWGVQFGESGYDDARAVAVDGAGRVYVAGTTDATLGAAAFGENDGFVRVFDAVGQVVWTHQFGTDRDEGVTALAVDPSGYAYVVGRTVGDLAAPGEGGADAFVRKLDPNGAEVWTVQFGTPAQDAPEAVAVAADGTVWVAGATSGLLGDVAQGARDVFVRKLAGDDGAEVWTHQFGTVENDDVLEVAVAATGDVYVAGITRGTLHLANAGGDDGFVRKLDADGQPLWTRQLGTPETDVVHALAVAPSGEVHVAGYTGGALGGPLVGPFDAFVRTFSAAGTVLGTEQFGTVESDGIQAMAIDADGNVVIAGFTYADLGGPNAGQDDVFVRKSTGEGVEVWTRQFGSDTFDGQAPVSLAVTPNGYAAVAGTTLGAVDGPHAGFDDVFVRVYGR